MIQYIAESVRTRLKNIAVQEGSDFNAILTRYGLERLLYRIGESKYANQFLLKGALLFNLWYDMPYRPTKDIDLLSYEQLDTQVLAQAIHATFIRRDMTVHKILPIGLTDEFANDISRQSMWSVFFKKNKLEQKSLAEVISVIRTLIQPSLTLDTNGRPLP